MTPEPALRVLVLGGPGWVGRHLCADLRHDGHRVTVVARRPAAHAAGLPFVCADLATITLSGLGTLLRDADVVVNATDAANAGDGWSPSPDRLAAVNVGLVRRLVRVCGDLGCRMVHLGTLHEHGADPGDGGYAGTKAAGSRLVLDAAAAAAVDATVLRCANVCGPYPSPAAFPGKLLDLLTSALRSGETAGVAVSATRRDWVDVRDVVRAVRLAAPGAGARRAFDVGSGRATAARTLVATLVRSAGLPPGLVRVHGDDDVPTLGGDETRARIGPAADALGWTPRIGLAESLRDMWSTHEAGAVVGPPPPRVHRAAQPSRTPT